MRLGTIKAVSTEQVACFVAIFLMLASYLLCLHAEPRSSGAFNRKLFGKKDASSWNGYKLKVSFSTVFGAWYALKLLARHSIVLVMLCLQDVACLCAARTPLDCVGYVVSLCGILSYYCAALFHERAAFLFSD